jgi:hypothetical protein
MPAIEKYVGIRNTAMDKKRDDMKEKQKDEAERITNQGHTFLPYPAADDHQASKFIDADKGKDEESASLTAAYWG